MDYLKRTWADISLDNLNHNYQQLRAKIPSGCRLLGVVKADACSSPMLTLPVPPLIVSAVKSDTPGMLSSR